MAALQVQFCRYCGSGRIQFKCLQCRTTFCEVCKGKHGKKDPKNYTHQIEDIRNKDADLHNKIDVERMKNTNSKTWTRYVAKWSVASVFVSLLVATSIPGWPLMDERIYDYAKLTDRLGYSMSTTEVRSFLVIMEIGCISRVVYPHSVITFLVINTSGIILTGCGVLLVLSGFYVDVLLMGVLYIAACYPFMKKKIIPKNAKETPFKQAGFG